MKVKLNTKQLLLSYYELESYLQLNFVENIRRLYLLSRFDTTEAFKKKSNSSGT